MFDRFTEDQPDDIDGPQIHFVYAIASDGEDHRLDTAGQIHYAVETAQDLLATKIQKVFRIDAYNGVPDITFVRISDFTERELAIAQGRMPRFLAGIGNEMEIEVHKLYAVFYTSSEPMGWDGYAGSKIAATFIKPDSVSDWELLGQWVPAAVMTHEVFHLLGAVPYCAPNLDPDGKHVNARESGGLDLMVASPSADSLDEIEIDFGRDDYYGHHRSDCPDIARSPWLRAAE